MMCPYALLCFARRRPEGRLRSGAWGLRGLCMSQRALLYVRPFLLPLSSFSPPPLSSSLPLEEAGAGAWRRGGGQEEVDVGAVAEASRDAA